MRFESHFRNEREQTGQVSKVASAKAASFGLVVLRNLAGRDNAAAAILAKTPSLDGVEFGLTIGTYGKGLGVLIWAGEGPTTISSSNLNKLSSADGVCVGVLERDQSSVPLTTAATFLYCKASPIPHRSLGTGKACSSSISSSMHELLEFKMIHTSRTIAGSNSCHLCRGGSLADYSSNHYKKFFHNGDNGVSSRIN